MIQPRLYNLDEKPYLKTENKDFFITQLLLEILIGDLGVEWNIFSILGNECLFSLSFFFSLFSIIIYGPTTVDFITKAKPHGFSFSSFFPPSF